MPPPPPAPPTKSRKRKVSHETTEQPPAAPSTPQKRRTKVAPAPPPATPTPSVIGLMAENAGVNGVTPTKRPRPAVVDRLADPNLTNAPLLSPETSRLIAPKSVAAIPSKLSGGHRTTTATLLQEANAHLVKVDARMKRLVDAHHCRIFSPEGLAEQIDPFESLASGIISQQVSGAAAKAIKGRFVALFDSDAPAPAPAAADGSGAGPGPEEKRRFPHPSQVAATPVETLRTAGLSQRKAEYVRGLAEKFVSGELSATMLAEAPYEEMVEKLTAVRGLGRWSVEMFAFFGLKRMDVFSLGDLGVQRGMAAFVGRDVAKLKASKGGKWKYMGEKEMEEIAERFRPYRSLFMWYMWRVEDTPTDVSTME
ncbi:DNA glycosylase [Coniochaeta ligniaria NRRL 30616]|uniref:DNA glycosylase n=1 Tax=Coniochaeta ligniaria NRRL 30616 TaxID=1408157 RepID=A0A1J7J0T5_9PEZI|nr:DNA glycosylase [Coniochaeta ligniaria NRRL 30616]